MKKQIKSFLCAIVDIIFAYLKWQCNFWNIALVLFSIINYIIAEKIYVKNISAELIFVHVFSLAYIQVYWLLKMSIIRCKTTKSECSDWVKRKYNIDEDFEDIY